MFVRRRSSTTTTSSKNQRTWKMIRNRSRNAKNVKRSRRIRTSPWSLWPYKIHQPNERRWQKYIISFSSDSISFVDRIKDGRTQFVTICRSMSAFWNYQRAPVDRARVTIGQWTHRASLCSKTVRFVAVREDIEVEKWWAILPRRHTRFVRRSVHRHALWFHRRMVSRPTQMWQLRRTTVWSKGNLARRRTWSTMVPIWFNSRQFNQLIRSDFVRQPAVSLTHGSHHRRRRRPLVITWIRTLVSTGPTLIISPINILVILIKWLMDTVRINHSVYVRSFWMVSFGDSNNFCVICSWAGNLFCSWISFLNTSQLFELYFSFCFYIFRFRCKLAKIMFHSVSSNFIGFENDIRRHIFAFF